MIHFHGHDVEVTARSNCRHLIMRYKAQKDLFCISMPVGVTQEAVLRFLEQNVGWMDEQKKKRGLDWQPSYAAGERHWVLGRLVTLGSDGVPCRQRAFLTYRQRQTEALVARMLPFLESRMGVKAAGLRWRTMTSRWGSCKTPVGLITLNPGLGAMPPQLVEYVLVHELCHIRYPNHSPAFWTEVARYVPDWKQRRELLNRIDVRPRQPEH